MEALLQSFALLAAQKQGSVLGLVAILVPFVAVSVLAWKGQSSSNLPEGTVTAVQVRERFAALNGATVPGDGGGAVTAVQLGVAGTPKVVVTPVGTTLTITRTFTPGWVIAVAILCFPLGLLAFLASASETGVVALEPVAGGTRVRFSGTFSLMLQARITMALDDLGSPAQVAGGPTGSPSGEQPTELQAVAAAPQQAPAPVLPPAGWYSDPKGTDAMRWWDGSAWTEHLQPNR